MSAPTLRNGRSVISFSILSCSLGRRGSCFRVVLLSPKNCSSSCFCSCDFTIVNLLDPCHAYFLSRLILCFGLQAFANIFTCWFTLAAKKNQRYLIGFSGRRTSDTSSFSKPLVRPTAPDTRFSSCSLESYGPYSCSRCTIHPIRTRRCSLCRHSHSRWSTVF